MTGPQTDPVAAHLRDLLAHRAIGGGRGDGGLESTTEAGRLPKADDVAKRVDKTLRRMREEAPNEIGNPREFEAALDTLIRAGRHATEALATPGRLAPDDLTALEAVIATDGTRPSLLIRDGTFTLDHPLAGGWSDGALGPIHGVIKGITAAVGRIGPRHASGRNFFGTGWVVDTGKGLILTNMHVLEAIWTELPHVITTDGAGYRIHDGVFIDFAAESDRDDDTKRFRVVQATPTNVDGVEHVRFDAAVLRIEPTNGAEVPAQIPVVPDINGPRGDGGDTFLIGYPGPPKHQRGRTKGNVDWASVYQALFGNIFGVKRFAPGQVHRPAGFMDVDERRWVFGHDATTLGGSSGSPVITFVGGAPVAIGLHYAGTSESTNYAHAFSKATTELAALGVPLSGQEGGSNGTAPQPDRP